MSFISDLSKYTGYVGRGAEDLFTLGGAEAGRKFGGQTGDKIFGILDKGIGANFEAGAAGGSSILGAQGLGAFGGSSGAMVPYTPTSTPVMGQAGSTLGGGMSSPLNLAPAYGSQMGAAAGSQVPAAAGSSTISQLLQGMRNMPSGGGGHPGQPPSQQRNLDLIYKMFPGLRPGANINQSPNVMGGQRGY